MQERRATRAVERVAVVCLLIAGVCLLHTRSASAQTAAVASQGTGQLQLAVTINGQPTNFISQFSDLGGGRLASMRSELEELGVKVPGKGPPTEVIKLDDIQSFAYSFDPRTQSVDLKLGDESRVRKTLRGSADTEAFKPQPSNLGAVLNYNLYAASQQQSLRSGQPTFQGANAGLDGRLLSPWGTVSQTAIAGTTLSQQSDFLRLESAYTYQEDPTATTYRVGDAISGGLNWTRPIRFGGVQIQRNFSLRPDLVSTAMPTLTGTAAVPSTVDVYVNNVKAYSQQVGAGPFQITDIPMLTGSGTARVVVTDAAGHQTQTAAPFFTAPRVLKEGVFDFSAESGLPRLNYGLRSDDYAEKPVGSASLRHGITDWLTGEAHVEGADGLANGGVGLVANVGGRGILSFAASGSTGNGQSGGQLYAGADTRLDKVTLHAHTQRTFAGYNDLASVTAQLKPAFSYLVGGIPIVAGVLGALRPPRAVDAFSASLPTLIDESFVNMSYLHIVPDDSTAKPSQLVSLSYTRSLTKTATMFASAYKDINDNRSAGLFVGVSMSLGDGMSASANYARNRNGETYSADVSKPLGQAVGAVGWSVHEGEGPDSYRSAVASTRTSVARVEGTLRQDTSGLRGTAEVEGSLVAMGGKIFAANRIDDAFAVVNVGMPGIKIMRENNIVGETDRDGQLLVPNVSSYQRNKIAIDPNGLPLNTEIEESSKIVTPSLRGGIDVKFNVKHGVENAIVLLHTADGKDVPPGSSGRLEGAAESFLVGYDGQAFIKGLKQNNTVVVTVAGEECKASFAYATVQGGQALIGPVVCQ